MPVIINALENDASLGQFNTKPFGMLTVLPSLFKQCDAQHLIFDIRTLPPNQYSFPYHYHRNAEEVMYVISGAMTMRTPDGFETVRAGQVVFCQKGESGAHQFFNHTETPCTYLDVKTFLGMDVVIYPDSDKIMISQYNEVFKQSEKVDYFEGEEDVGDKWKSLGYKR